MVGSAGDEVEAAINDSSVPDAANAAAAAAAAAAAVAVRVDTRTD